MLPPRRIKRRPQSPCPGSLRESRRLRAKRRAVITLELILALPIMIIFLFAVVEFGLILASAQQVSYASRFGAKLASEEPRSSIGGLGDFNTASGGSRLRTEIDRFLDTAGFATGACRVTLQHNVSGIDNPLQTDPDDGCDCAMPMDNLPTMREYVRVTVCVPFQGNIPDLLCGFGVSMEDCHLESTTTFRYENSPGP